MTEIHYITLETSDIKTYKDFLNELENFFSFNNFQELLRVSSEDNYSFIIIADRFAFSDSYSYLKIKYEKTKLKSMLNLYNALVIQEQHDASVFVNSETLTLSKFSRSDNDCLLIDFLAESGLVR